MAELPLTKNAKTLSFIGAGLLALSVFMPIISVPIVGSITLISGATEYGVIILLLAAAGGVLAYLGHTKHVIWPGAIAALLLTYGLIRYWMAKSEMRSGLDAEMKDNPFGGLAEAFVDAVQLQIGWVPIAVGAGLLIYAGWLGRNPPVEETAKDFD